ncbi:MAG: tetratricopeptide repeat protein [Alphaproteobacteria bacterium]
MSRIKNSLPGSRRFLKFGWVSVALLAAACASDPGETHRAALEAQREATTVDTLLRVAENTRAGGNGPAAVNLYRRAHLLDPERIEPLIELGVTLNAMQAHRDAVDAFRAALTLEPEHVGVLRELANTLLALNQPNLAYAEFEKILKLNKADVAALNGMGIALDRLGDHDGAQTRYRQVLALAPNSLAARNNLGLSMALAGKHEAAIALLQEVANDPSATPRERQNLALAHGIAGDFEAAAKVARMDLDEAAVENNLAYYRYLQTLSGPARANAAMGGGSETSEAAVTKGN